MYDENFITPSKPEGAKTVATFGDLPVTATTGEQRLVIDTGKYYYWDRYGYESSSDDVLS